MKLNTPSELHVGYSALDTPLNDADVTVLAGDVAPPRQAAQWAMRLSAAFAEARCRMHDFSRIRIDDGKSALFTIEV